MLKNPIPKNNFFITPKSLDDVLVVINRMPKGQRAEATLAVQMALNWAHTEVQEYLELADELGLTG